MSINLTQEFVFESDEISSVRKVLEVIVPVMFHEPGGKHISFRIAQEAHFWNDGAKYNADGTKTGATRMFVGCLTDYAGEHERENDIHCSGHDAMVEVAVRLLEKADLVKFRELCGDGHTHWFNHSDGDIHPGFRLHYEPSGGWNKLLLSICQIYYGK